MIIQYKKSSSQKNLPKETTVCLSCVADRVSASKRSFEAREFLSSSKYLCSEILNSTVGISAYYQMRFMSHNK